MSDAIGFRYPDASPEDASSACALSCPVVTIQVCYRSGSTLPLMPPGKGFLIEAWPRCVITARHVVVPSDGAVPHYAAITLSTDAGEVTWRALTCGHMFDEEPSHDLAVLWLPAEPTGDRLPVLLDHPAEGIAVPIVALDFSGAGEGTPLLETTARVSGPWLKYASRLDLPGMSGCPVLTSGSVLGVHVRAGLALTCQFEGMLNRCMRAAGDA